MGNDTNSLPNLLELVLRIVPSKRNPNGFDLLPELRIAKGVVESEEDISFEVALKRVWLDLVLDGLEPISGTRFGEPIKQNEAEAKQKTSHEVVKEAEVYGSAGISADPSHANASLSAGAKGKALTKTVHSTTSTEKISHLKVKARPNLKWEVTESPQLDELDGTYLEGNPLCSVTAKRGANFKSVRLNAAVRQRDLTLRAQNESRLNPFRNSTKEKMMKILIAKALSGNEKFNGIIEFSRSGIEIEESGEDG